MLFKFLKSWHRSLEKGCFVGAILMDLREAFECLPHLLIAKLEAIGSGKGSILNCFNDRKHRAKKN